MRNAYCRYDFHFYHPFLQKINHKTDRCQHRRSWPSVEHEACVFSRPHSPFRLVFNWVLHCLSWIFAEIMCFRCHITHKAQVKRLIEAGGASVCLELVTSPEVRSPRSASLGHSMGQAFFFLFLNVLFCEWVLVNTAHTPSLSAAWQLPGNVSSLGQTWPYGPSSGLRVTCLFIVEDRSL